MYVRKVAYEDGALNIIGMKEEFGIPGLINWNNLLKLLKINEYIW